MVVRKLHSNLQWKVALSSSKLCGLIIQAWRSQTSCTETSPSGQLRLFSVLEFKSVCQHYFSFLCAFKTCTHRGKQNGEWSGMYPTGRANHMISVQLICIPLVEFLTTDKETVQQPRTHGAWQKNTKENSLWGVPGGKFSIAKHSVFHQNPQSDIKPVRVVFIMFV